MKIHTMNPVWTECSKEIGMFIRHELCYNYDEWVFFGGRRKKMVRTEYLIEPAEDGNSFFFYTGFVPRVLKYLKIHRQPYRYTSDVEGIDWWEPHIEGVTFRDYQYDLIIKALEHGYGVVKSPTGSGKSMIIFGIMSAFQNSNILVLAHTLDIVQQLYDDLEKFGFDPVMYRTGTDVGRITVSTVQSYHKVSDEYSEYFDVVIADEGHHISQAKGGMYFEVLAYSMASARFAVTATEGDTEEQRTSLEGLIGPVVAELTMAEGTELGLLAKATIKFIRCPLPHALFMQNFDRDGKKVTSYTADYKVAIVENVNRNIRIATTAEAEVTKGGSVLILVKHIKHTRLIAEHLDIDVEIVQGSVDNDERLRIKNGMKAGEIKCVIATPAWVEGVDIPSLTMVINASGGKSERETLQRIGRALRKTDGKTEATIVDFFDMADTSADPFKRSKKGKKHVFHRQSIERYKVCEDQGWDMEIL